MRLIFQWTGGQRADILTKIFKDKVTWEAARANVGISRPFVSKASGSMATQNTLHNTVDIVRKAAEKPSKLPAATAAVKASGLVAAAAIRSRAETSRIRRPGHSTARHLGARIAQVLTAAIFILLFASAMSSNQQSVPSAQYRGTGGSAAPKIVAGEDLWAATSTIAAQPAQALRFGSPGFHR